MKMLILVISSLVCLGAGCFECHGQTTIELDLEDSSHVIYHVNHGRLHGSYQSFHANGQPKAKGTLDRNQRIGEWTVYDSTGTLISTRKYENPYVFQLTYPVASDEGPIQLLSKPIYYPSRDSNGTFEYFELEERAIVWLKRVWRTIPPDDNETIYQTHDLFKILKQLSQSGEVITYDGRQSSGDMLIEKLRPEEIDWTNLELIEYKIKEEIFFDKDRYVSEKRIIAICPVVYNGSDTFDLCWFYYFELRHQLAKITLSEPKDLLHNLDDVFVQRDFASSIYKVSNVRNWKLEDYTDNLQLESRRQEIRLLEQEHNLWMHFANGKAYRKLKKY